MPIASNWSKVRTSSGAFSLTTSKYWTILRGWSSLDADQQEHPGGVLGDVVAERVAAEERLEGVAGLGEPAGVEVGLAAGVELVGRRLVGVGVRLAGRADAELAGRAEVEPARLVGAPDRWRAGRDTGRGGSRRRRSRSRPGSRSGGK